MNKTKLINTFLCITLSTFSTSLISTQYMQNNHKSKQDQICNLNITNDVNNSLWQFNNTNISAYQLTNNNTTLNVNINTTNLNTSNDFTYINVYCPYTPYYVKQTKTTYVYIPNNALNINLQLNKQINYANINNQTYSFNTLFNQNSSIETFVNNFLNNDYFDALVQWVDFCYNKNLMANLFVSKTNLNTTSSYCKEKLYEDNVSKQMLEVNQILNQWQATGLKNQLFAGITLNNMMQIKQIDFDVYQVIRTFYYDTQWPWKTTPSVSYSTTPTVLSLTFSFLNAYNYKLFFNPNLLYEIYHIPSQLNNNEPYLTLPNLNININQQLAQVLYSANICSLLFNVLVNNINNQQVTSLLNTAWNNHLVGVNYFMQLFNLLGNNIAYSNINNAISWQTKNVLDSNLINLLQTINKKAQIADWYSNLLNLANVQQFDYAPNFFINLYQTLLITYQQSNLKISFTNSQNKTQVFNLSNNNCLINLNSVTIYNQTSVYLRNFVINSVIFIMQNAQTTIKLDDFDQTSSNSLINNQISFNCLLYSKYLIPIFKTSKNTFNQYHVFNLDNLIWTNSLIDQNLISLLKTNQTILQKKFLMFNNNKTINFIDENNQINQPYYWLIYLSVINSIFSNLINQQNTLINYLNQNNFSNNVFNNNNNALISNVEVITNYASLNSIDSSFNQNEFNNMQKANILAVVFNLNNLINTSTLIKNNLLQVIQDTPDDYNSKYLMFIQCNSLNSSNNSNKQTQQNKITKTNQQPLNKTEQNKQSTKNINKTITKSAKKKTNWKIYLWIGLCILLIVLFVFIIYISRVIRRKLKIKKFTKKEKENNE